MLGTFKRTNSSAAHMYSGAGLHLGSRVPAALLLAPSAVGPAPVWIGEYHIGSSGALATPYDIRIWPLTTVYRRTPVYGHDTLTPSAVGPPGPGVAVLLEVKPALAVSMRGASTWQRLHTWELGIG